MINNKEKNGRVAISGLCSRLAKNYLHKPASRNRDSPPSACLLLSLVTSLIFTQFDFRGISAPGEMS